MVKFTAIFSILLIAVTGCVSQSTPTINIDLLLTGNFYKCSCNVGEVLIDGRCQPSTVDQLIPVWDSNKELVTSSSVSNFNVTVRPITCSEGKSVIRIDLLNILIYPNGLLYNLILTETSLTDDYCVEFTPHNADSIGFAELCGQNPSIPLCCKRNHVLNEESECAEEVFRFDPPLFGTFSWKEYSTFQRDILCPANSILRKEHLSLPFEYGASLIGYPLGSTLQWLTIYTTEPSFFTQAEYCISISKVTDKSFSYHAQFCTPNPKISYKEECRNATCIRKCCPLNYIYDSYYSSCIPSNYSVEFTTKLDGNLNISKLITVIYELPCDEFYVSEIETDHNTALLSSNGLPISRDGLSHNGVDFCVDGIVNNFQNPHSKVDLSSLVCFLPFEEKCRWRWIVGSSFLGISCIFYLATITVYICIEDLRRKIAGKCLICELTALLVAYLVLIYLQNNRTYSGVACHLPGTIEHIASLAAFFWLNILCYDMWSNLKSVKSIKIKGASSKKFAKYCIYGWGVPILIAAVRLAVDYVPDEIHHPILVKSDIGQTHCFFSSDKPTAKWVYLYFPVLMILLVNLLFFIHITLILINAQGERKSHIDGPDSSTTGKNLSANKERLRLYLKLFIVMGMTWIIEIVTWVAAPADNCYHWLIDIVNMFQGVFIFAIFACKKSVLRKVKKYFMPIRNHPQNTQKTTSEEIPMS